MGIILQFYIMREDKVKNDSTHIALKSSSCRSHQLVTLIQIHLFLIQQTANLYIREVEASFFIELNVQPSYTLCKCLMQHRTPSGTTNGNDILPTVTVGSSYP